MSEPFIGRTQVLEVVSNHIRRSVPALGTRPINPDATLEQLGGHSLVAADIVNGSLSELRIAVPARELANARTTNQLVDVLLRHLGR